MTEAFRKLSAQEKALKARRLKPTLVQAILFHITKDRVFPKTKMVTLRIPSK